MSESLLTRRQVAERLAVSESTVKRLVARGDLRRVRLLGTVRYDAGDVDSLVRRCKDGSELATRRAVAPVSRTLTEGQLRAFHAKAADLDRKLGVQRGTSKARVLVEASERFGRLIDHASGLRAAEASWVLDMLEGELVAA